MATRSVVRKGFLRRRAWTTARFADGKEWVPYFVSAAAISRSVQCRNPQPAWRRFLSSRSTGWLASTVSEPWVRMPVK